MAKRIFVSSAQKSAAQAMVDRSAVTGRKVSNSVRRIANAKVAPVKAKSTQADVPHGTTTANTES